MAMRLLGNYGIIRVRVEEIDSTTGDLINVINPSTLMYLPIKVSPDSLPNSVILEVQPHDYFLQFFSDITFLGCGTVVVPNASLGIWADISATIGAMSLYVPLTNDYYVTQGTGISNLGTIKVTDIGSGYYFTTSGTARFYRPDGYLMGEVGTYGFGTPYEPGYTNIYSCNFCILDYNRVGDECEVISIGTVGCRGINDSTTRVYSTYSDRCNKPFVIEWLNNVARASLPDPYENGGNSTPSEMTGDFDGTSDEIDFPDLPTLSAVDAGFIAIYNPTLQQLKNLATYMWNDSLFSIAGWQKLFANPMDAILALAIVPVAVPNGGTVTVKVGNVDTTVPMTKAQAQYVELDCGTLNVNEYWSAYLDYEPHTKCEIYLPYCGTHQLSVDDIMNKPVHVKYHIDILSGGCVAYVKCGGSVLYEFSGQCATMIPISAQEYGNVIASVVSVAVSVGSMIATSGAVAPLALPALANTALNGGLKPNFEKSGSMSSVAGLLSIQKPYLILTRPRQAHPENQNHYTGYPSFITENLSDLSGYTEIEEIHLENVDATNSELDEIITLLESGVIF